MDLASNAALPLPEETLANVGRPALPRGLTLTLLAVLLMFIGMEGRSLWQEWTSLQRELAGARNSAVIGYFGIQPRFSYARRPRNWFRQEENQTFLWGGWVDGEGHSWFKTSTGDVLRERISAPAGRDVQLAIDHPIVEMGGGDIWSRVPDEALMLVGQLAGVSTAYPLLVMDKVGVVNDQIDAKPYLVAYNPLGPNEARVRVFDPTLNGRRITMGLTGYFHDRIPMLYDRGTESLWVVENDQLKAIAGEHKGQVLPQVARAKALSFRDWRSANPEGRLLVGGNRTLGRPEL